jgi:energy-coupling factor transport system ATP-binding protein
MIEVNGRDTSLSPTAEMARSVCVTFQHPEDQIFSSTVLKEVTFGPANLRRPDPESLARRALALLGLEQLRTRHPYDLQPAERKLLTIASAVASDAPILAFDEPTVRLSQPERIILHRAFRTLQREGRTLLLVSHDLEFCLPLASQLLILSAGRCVFVGAAAEIWSRQSELRRAGVRIPLPVRIRPHLGLGETLPSPA